MYLPEKNRRKQSSRINGVIWEGTISNILTRDKATEFFAEKMSILEAGMMKAKYLQADESGARHQGRNCYLHVICNDMFSYFTITGGKNRPTIYEILGQEDDEKLETPFVTDGARQYLDVSNHHAKCWIHEIRHYKKLVPFLDHHKSLLDKVMGQLWGLFDLMNIYKNHPDESLRVIIE
ncbi:MAG TPA: transposase [Methanotrichaceae archaeon]|nr:transposase [Methanotrichaceae archaeon]